MGLFVPARLEDKVEQLKEHRSFEDPEVSGVLSVQPYPALYSYRSLTMIAKCVINDGKIAHLSYIPCFVNEKKQPEVLKNDEKGQQALAFMEKITKMAGLNTRYEWEGDEIIVLSH